MEGRRITVWVQQFRDRDALQLQWLDPETGKRSTRSAGTADPQEAERKRADLEYELNHGLHAEPSRMTWGEFRAAFEREVLSSRRPNTRANYRRTFDLFERLCSPLKLSAVTARTVSGFVAALRQLPEKGRGGVPGFKASTIELRSRQIRAALAWAVGQKLIAAAPAFPKIDLPKKRPQPVPPETVERLLERLSDAQTRAFALCAWLAGLRRDEAFWLAWEASETCPWVNLGARRIVFPAAATKGKEDSWVPLDPELEQALVALPSYQTGGQVFRFVGRGGKAVNSMTAGRWVIKAARRAGVVLTMRTLRRGFGCRYAVRVPAQVLQRLMRHAKIEVTMEYYCNVDGALEEAIFGRNRPRNTMGTTRAEIHGVTDASPEKDVA